jgi:formate hydrogenlyase subunit 3/multisubunit Na+/H+ antiporter MnhD subunit
MSALLAGVVTEAGLIALLRALAPLPSFANLLLVFGIVNMVVGNVLALRQRDLKRLLAFSSLPHVGFMIFGIGIGLTTGTPGGIQGGLFHLLNHGLMKGLAFFAAGALLVALHRQQGIDRPLRIDDLAGAARRAPLASVALALALFSLAGVPPLAGFMSKWQIFVAGVSSGSAALAALTVFAALNSVFSLAYYLPVVNALFRSSAGAGAPALVSRTVQIPLVVLSVALIVVGLLPDAFNWLTHPASLALIGSLSGR